jgi:hypothetical protein
VGKPSIALAVILVVLAGCAKSVSGSFNLGLTAITVVVLCGPGLAYTGWCWLRRDQTRDLTPEQEYKDALAIWNQRTAEHETAELASLANQPRRRPPHAGKGPLRAMKVTTDERGRISDCFHQVILAPRDEGDLAPPDQRQLHLPVCQQSVAGNSVFAGISIQTVSP